MNSKKKFAIVGVAGYIAVRHLRAIKETNNTLIAALDKFDNVGILDSYFPYADFFVEFERFDRHIDKLRRIGQKVDYISICTPNYMHDSQIRFALKNQADAICEKPVVLNPWNVDALMEIEIETGRKVNNIFQLRLHEDILNLKREFESGSKDKIYDIDLTYITSRGNWYFTSWKADIQKSGGVSTNIGVHFFDMLIWIFGKVEKNIVHVSDYNKAAGFLRLRNANVRWFLSVDFNDLPPEIKETGQRTYRSIEIDGKELEFSNGFTDLHTKNYELILKGDGVGLEEARSSIQVVYEIRNSDPIGVIGDYHPILGKTN